MLMGQCMIHETPTLAEGAAVQDSNGRTSLRWCMGVVTYRREDTLPTTLCLAALQSRVPAELVVVDASPDWRHIERRCRAQLDACGATVPLHYYGYPDAPSIPAQRNYLLERTNCDVVFFLDDDSYMHPGCAERIMSVYEADQDGHIHAVAAKPSQQCPDLRHAQGHDVRPQAVNPPDQADAVRSRHGRSVMSALRKQVRRPLGHIRKRLRQRLQPHNMFVPYDDDFPRMKLPQQVIEQPVRPLPLMEGFTMTMRAEAARRCGFESRMVRGGEDLDFSYRLSRYGAIVRAYTAHVYHAQSRSGRNSPYRATALEATNPLFCHRVHSTDRVRSRSMLRRTYVRRILLEAIDDLAASRWSMPRARGFVKGFARIRGVLALPDEQVDARWRGYQERTLGRPVALSHATDLGLASGASGDHAE